MTTRSIRLGHKMLAALCLLSLLLVSPPTQAATQAATALPLDTASLKAAAGKGKVMVACVGDSITFGAGVQDRKNNNYPKVLNGLLGDGYTVGNFGVSARTLLKKGDHPIWKEKAFKQATEMNPHVVIIKLGTNDTKPHNWKHKGELAGDLKAMIAHFRATKNKPAIVLLQPVPAFPERWGISDQRIKGELIPAIKQVAKETGAATVDLHTPFADKPQYFPDKIHPNAAGAKMMATIIAKQVFGVNADKPSSDVASATKTATDRKPANLPEGYKLALHLTFDDKSVMDKFHFTDKSAWRLGKDEKTGKHFIEHFKKSNYKYKVRSPFNIALYAGMEFGSFVLDCEMQQTGREYGHRDMCLFYNFQNRSQFYYTHIASVSDKNAHQCFIVNNKPRTKITIEGTKGFKWSKGWHHMRVVRDIESGKTEIYVDDMKKPIMVAKDKSFGFGQLGFGSFDDTGRIANVRVYAKDAKKVTPKKHLFKD